MLFLPMAIAASLAQTSSSVEITVYNQGFGFVKEVRSINFASGLHEIAIEDVAAFIEPNSVGVRSLDPNQPFEVLEQNYQYDLISVRAILNKSVGQRIKFHRTLPNGVKETIAGILVSSPNAIVNNGNGASQTYNGMVLKTDNGRVLLDPTGEIEVEQIPDGLISVPTLKWLVNSSKSGSRPIELSYLTQNMSWNCDYVMTLDDKSKTSNLKGWVTLGNQSGKSFVDAKLKLLAGDVQRAPTTMPGGFGGGRGGAMAKADMGFSEESLFEYHLYTLQRPTTVKNNETKQVSLLEAPTVPYTKKLIVDSMLNFGMYYPSEGEIGTGDIKPQVRVEFENKKENGLGIPLPKGKVKVYQRDSSGSVQMLGEDNIDHTPKDEHLSIVVGKSFDVRATRKRLNFKRLGPSHLEETFEIEVRNRKDVPETVHVYERHFWQWNVTDTSEKWNKLDSQTQEYVLNLKAGEVKTLKYTVQTKW